MKSEEWLGEEFISEVAPLVGAWIEIIKYSKDTGEVAVAPLVGAWIEILYLMKAL